MDKSRQCGAISSFTAMAAFAHCFSVLLVLMCQYEWAVSQIVHKLAMKSDIRFRFATTQVECVMSNNQSSARELLFDFILPKEAFITNFSMTIDGEEYPGQVKEKGEERQEYLTTLSRGHTGGLVEESTRHTNKFDVSINIAPGGNVTFNLLYQELLRRRFGNYEHLVHVNPNTGAQEFSIEVYIQEVSDIKHVRTPQLRKDILSNAVSEDENAFTLISQPTPATAHVLYRPTVSQLDKTGSCWFVVQYDVTSANTGELLVVGGYFVHFFVPPDMPPLGLDIVFVLDRSGSMSGRPLEQLKDAMKIILGDLRRTDRFNIITFDDGVNVWQPDLHEASQNNVNRSLQHANSIRIGGSTNLHTALLQGVRLLQKARTESRVPVLFFLTDGEATAGETRSDRIISDVTEANDGVANIYCLAFGSSADYDLLKQVAARNNGFACKVYFACDAALQVAGLYTEISTVILRGMTISYLDSSPSDSNTDDGDIVRIDNSSLTTCVFPTVFGQTDAVVAGRILNPAVLAEGAPHNLTLTISGQGASGKVNLVLDDSLITKMTFANDGDNPFWSVPRDLAALTERSWVYLTIQRLLHQKEAFKRNETLVKELDAKMLSLSLKYHFVTPLTSMVVTRPEDNDKKGDDNVQHAASFTDADDRRDDDKSGIFVAHSVGRQAFPMAQHRPGLSGPLRYPRRVLPPDYDCTFSHARVRFRPYLYRPYLSRPDMPPPQTVRTTTQPRFVLTTSQPGKRKNKKGKKRPSGKKTQKPSKNTTILQAALLSDFSSDPKICLVVPLDNTRLYAFAETVLQAALLSDFSSDPKICLIVPLDNTRLYAFAETVLQAALLSDFSSDPKICVELMPNWDLNYTLFESPAEHFRVMTGVKNTTVSFLAISRGAESLNVSVSEGGQLALQSCSAGLTFANVSRVQDRLDFQIGDFNVSIFISKKTFSKTFLVVKVTNPPAGRLYRGVLGDANTGKLSKRRKNAKVSQLCKKEFKTSDPNSHRLVTRKVFGFVNNLTLRTFFLYSLSHSLFPKAFVTASSMAASFIISRDFDQEEYSSWQAGYSHTWFGER